MATSALAVMFAATLAATPAPRPPNLYDNFAVPTFQLLAAEAMVVGSFLFFDRFENGATYALVLLSPVTVPLTTCLIGSSSLRYRGRCGYAFGGMGLGIVSGFVVLALLEFAPGLNPFSANQDDTQEFVNTIAAVAYVMLVGIPVGSVVGWNLGKQPLEITPPLPSPSPPPPPGNAHLGFGPLRFMVPLLSLRF